MSQFVAPPITMASLGRAALALNGASVIRTLRCGITAGAKALYDSYTAVDPFSAAERSKSLSERIPVRPLREVITPPESLELDLRWVDIAGSTPLNDIVSILSLAVAQQPEAALEFGTFYGSTTANLARNLPLAKIHTIDLPPEGEQASKLIGGQAVDDEHLIRSRQLGKAFVGTPLALRIVQHTGDTATYDYSAIRDRVSFFLIDGSHTYEYAKSDTLKALSLAHGECTFAWHDCDADHPGVTGWLGELFDAGLPVARIEGTVVACLRIKAEDERMQRFLKE